MDRSLPPDSAGPVRNTNINNRLLTESLAKICHYPARGKWFNKIVRRHHPYGKKNKYRQMKTLNIDIQSIFNVEISMFNIEISMYNIEVSMLNIEISMYNIQISIFEYLDVSLFDFDLLTASSTPQKGGYTAEKKNASIDR